MDWDFVLNKESISEAVAAIMKPKVLSGIYLVSATLLTGCKTSPLQVGDEQHAHRQPQTSVSREIILPRDSNVYTREDGVFYTLPKESDGNLNPSYPRIDSTIASDTVVTVKLLVDTRGQVYDVRDLNGDKRGEADPFVASVVAACMKWAFSPLLAHRENVVPDGTVFGAPKVRVISSTEPLPFSRDYRFFFSRNGKVEVRRDEQK